MDSSSSRNLHQVIIYRIAKPTAKEWILAYRSDMISMEKLHEGLSPLLPKLWTGGNRDVLWTAYDLCLQGSLLQNKPELSQEFVYWHSVYSSFYNTLSQFHITSDHIEAMQDHFRKKLAQGREKFSLPPYEPINQWIDEEKPDTVQELEFAEWQLSQPLIIKHPPALRRAAQRWANSSELHMLPNLDDVPVTYRRQVAIAVSREMAARIKNS